MIQKISSPVSVGLTFDHLKCRVYPKWVIWNKRLYPVSKVGLHHTYREGRTLFHIFSVSAGAVFFRLKLNSETLHWKLEEVSDGMPD